MENAMKEEENKQFAKYDFQYEAITDQSANLVLSNTGTLYGNRYSVAIWKYLFTLQK